MNSNTQNQKYNRDFGHPYKGPRQTTHGQLLAPIVSRRPANFWRCDPSKARNKEKRTAIRILKRNAATPITEDQTSSREDYLKIQQDIAWAEAVVSLFQLDVRQKDEVEPTRETLIVEVRNPAAEVPPIGLDNFTTEPLSQISPIGLHQMEDDSYNDPLTAVESPSPRLLRTYETSFKSFIKLARDSIIVGVIDRSQPNGNIPRSQWGWIQASLAAVALEVLKEYTGPPPLCTAAGWYQGTTKLIACDNIRSVMLYKAAIAKVGEVYSGAQLEVIDLQDIPSQPWATAWLPKTPSESRAILEVLSNCNTNLPTRNWDVIKAVRFKEASMEVIFRISHESIVYLTRCDGLLSYGLNHIHMKFYRTPHEALSNLEAFAAAVDPPTDQEWDYTDSLLNQDLTSESDNEGS